MKILDSKKFDLIQIPILIPKREFAVIQTNLERRKI